VAAADPPVRDSSLFTGIRILDFTFQGAGAYASMLLAALGADVIKVESSQRPDPTRGRENRPYLRSLLFDDVNLGKRAISLDMKTDEGRRVAWRLAEHCDAVIDNFRPGVMKRWGLGFESISAANPQVVSASLSAMGSGGPLADLPGYAGIFNALSGLGGLNGYADGPPTELRTSVDMRAGAFFAFSIAQGLLAARLSGAGSRIDLSATECITALTGEYLTAYLLFGDQPVRSGNDAPGEEIAHGVYASADQAWVAVAVRTEQEWQRLALPANDLAGAEETLSDWLAGTVADEAVTRLQLAGAAAAVIEDAAALAADPQHAHRRFFTELPPRANGERRMAAAAPWLTNGMRPPVQPGPEIGADTTAVLRDLLTMTDEEITALSESGALQ
jgi:crotonobetainyl-CoA:carnitine CoA-transferase CaiB-like acyl-CoA transferase